MLILKISLGSSLGLYSALILLLLITFNLVAMLFRVDSVKLMLPPNSISEH